jgi:hypothetical protein
VSVAIALWLLATVDAACCGYRAAAGRNALIGKGRYYRRAMLRGALWGQTAVAIAAIALLAFVLSDDDPGRAWVEATGAGLRMLAVYVPYAAVIGLAFALRLAPSVDLRSLTSTVVFGPLTLLRPAVAILGVAWGVSSSRPALVAIGGVVLALMLSMESLLASAYLAARLRREAAAPSTVPRPGTS